VYDEKYATIKDVLKSALASVPTVITFRAPIKTYGKEEFGRLWVRVVAALNLIASANYVQVKVGSTKLNTRSLKKRQNLDWQEKLAFKKFRPAVGKRAHIQVCETRTILSDRVIGSCEMILPRRFSTMTRETLELTDKKGNVTGLVVIHCVAIPQKK